MGRDVKSRLPPRSTSGHALAEQGRVSGCRRVGRAGWCGARGSGFKHPAPSCGQPARHHSAAAAPRRWQNRGRGLSAKGQARADDDESDGRGPGPRRRRGGAGGREGGAGVADPGWSILHTWRSTALAPRSAANYARAAGSARRARFARFGGAEAQGSNRDDLDPGTKPALSLLP